MTFDQIRVFVCLAKHLSVTKAADELHTTQPNLSKHLKALEDGFRALLFTRYSKGLKLTEKGRDFLGDVEPLIGQWQRINRRYSNDTTTKSAVARLRVAGTYGAAATLLPAPLALFKKTHLDVELSVWSNSTVRLEEMVLAGELDLAVCPKLPDSSPLMAEHYLTSKLVLFVANDGLLAGKKNLTLADIVKLPLVIRSGTGKDGGTATLLETIRQQGHEPKIALRCDQPDAIKEAVWQHAGVGVLYYDTVEEAIRRGAFKELKVRDLNIEGRLYIVYHKIRPLSPNGAAFLQLLRQQRDRKATRAVMKKPLALKVASAD
jgi:LysR family transcriptional regulator, low CO2-responsive transcriptional regulator